jgi:hypothetical protein
VTHGSDLGIKCPCCRKFNSVVIHTAQMRAGEVREFVDTCKSCGRRVYYWARWAVGKPVWLVEEWVRRRRGGLLQRLDI